MTAPPRQLALDLTARPELGRGAFFVGDSNRAALAMIDGGDWPDGRLMLTGPEGSGKTHLGNIWAEAAGATPVDAPDLAGADIPALAQTGALVIDRVDALGGEPAAQEAVFHLYNLAAAERTRMLLLSRAAPARLALGVPDLASRLTSVTLVELGPPDDALLAAVLVKLLADRQRHVPPDLVAYVATRIERSLAAADRAVIALDRAAAGAKRPITKPLAREILGALEDGRGLQ